jgi:hypothetical protein
LFAPSPDGQHAGSGWPPGPAATGTLTWTNSLCSSCRIPERGPPRPTTFIVTATTLIQVAGFAILTDPDFLHRGDRALARCQMASPAWTTSACGGATASEA